MMKKAFSIFSIVLSMASCTSPSEKSIEVQGHRGARGLVPENSIPSFKKALDLGVHTLELDVVISKDKKVVLSHEPYMSAAICKDADGNDIREENEKEFNIYNLDYEQIKQFDCGSRGNVRFPEQQKQSTYKPLLSQMIQEIEEYVEQNDLPKRKYNIEIKSEPEGDGKFHPAPDEFSDLVYKAIEGALEKERINIQSFDKRILIYWRNTYPTYKLAYLVEEAFTPQQLKEELGFLPEIYSPYYETLTEDLVKKYHALNVKVIPWTINETDDMRRIASWNVDGIITDYPDRAKGIFE